MKKTSRLPAMFLACVLALILLFSVFFIVLEADHDCCGDGCAICAVLSVCETLLHRLAGVGAVVLAMLFAASVKAFAAGGYSLDAASVTPVSLRVKLTD